MKSVLLLVVLGSLLSGCTNVPEPEVTKPPAPPVKTAETATKPAQPTAIPADVNPNRSYQLQDLDKVVLKISGKPVELWVMDSENKREEGMMFLTDKEVRNDQGMLFVFPGPQSDPKHGFWMHNTVLPLDIIYIAQDKKVINVQAGKPFDDKNLPAAAAFQYVIELKQGQAKALGIKPGVTIAVPANAKASE